MYLYEKFIIFNERVQTGAESFRAFICKMTTVTVQPTAQLSSVELRCGSDAVRLLGTPTDLKIQLGELLEKGKLVRDYISLALDLERQSLSCQAYVRYPDEVELSYELSLGPDFEQQVRSALAQL